MNAEGLTGLRQRGPLSGNAQTAALQLALDALLDAYPLRERCCARFEQRGMAERHRAADASALMEGCCVASTTGPRHPKDYPSAPISGTRCAVPDSKGKWERVMADRTDEQTILVALRTLEEYQTEAMLKTDEIYESALAALSRLVGDRDRLQQEVQDLGAIRDRSGTATEPGALGLVDRWRQQHEEAEFELNVCTAELDRYGIPREAGIAGLLRHIYHNRDTSFGAMRLACDGWQERAEAAETDVTRLRDALRQADELCEKPIREVEMGIHVASTGTAYGLAVRVRAALAARLSVEPNEQKELGDGTAVSESVKA